MHRVEARSFRGCEFPGLLLRRPIAVGAIVESSGQRWTGPGIHGGGFRFVRPACRRCASSRTPPVRLQRFGKIALNLAVALQRTLTRVFAPALVSQGAGFACTRRQALSLPQSFVLADRGHSSGPFFGFIYAKITNGPMLWDARYWKNMVPRTRIERATCRLGGGCSIH